MNIKIRAYQKEDAQTAIAIWNEVVEDGRAFPQKDILDKSSGNTFFLDQSYTGIAYDTETENEDIVGLYILHPNNVGRCGHICNASYAVKAEKRGLHIGELLVKDCLQKAKELGFRILQFNAVVCSNTAALNLYKQLGFTQLGVIPQGFLNKDNEYEDIIPHYYVL